MIETMNNYHQAYDAEDPSEDGNGNMNDYSHAEQHNYNQPQPHPYNPHDSALEDISDVFIRELFRREATFHSSTVPMTVPDMDNNLYRSSSSSSAKRKRQDTINVSYSSSLSTQTGSGGGEGVETATAKSEDIADTTPFFTFKDVKDDIRSKTREELEFEVNRFNAELEKRKAELGLGESSHLDLSSMKKRREKWSPDEMGTLWGAISLHGNNWTAISKIVPGRNYFQVKDKGRRELCGRGWETGRKKSEGTEAMLHAQAIAQIELQKFFKGKAAAKQSQASGSAGNGEYSPMNSAFTQLK